MKNTYKLFILDSHPVPYRIPIYKKLSKNNKINLMVYFCNNNSLKKRYNKAFGTTIIWLKKNELSFNHKFLNLFYCLSEKYFGIIKELIKNRPDAILIYGYQSTTHRIALLTAKLIGIPIIFRDEIDFIDHSSPVSKKIKNIILPILFNLPSAFLYSYTRSKEFYLSRGVSKEKLFFHPCAVDNDLFQKQSQQSTPSKIKQYKKQYDIPQNTKVISYIGRLTKRKRPIDTLSAYNKLKDKEKYSLVFVGGGEQKEEILKFKKEHNLKNVFVIDFIENKKLYKIYSMSSLFIIPSDYDPSPKVMNEAMNFSLPIIASKNVGTSQDLIRSGKNGFIFEVGDIKNLSKKIGEILSNSKLGKKMGMESLKIVSQWNFEKDVNVTIKALDYIYKK